MGMTGEIMTRGMHIRRIGHAFIVVAVVLGLLTAVGRPAVGESHGRQTISGLVSADEYDDDGEVSAVSIFDPGH